MNESIFISLRLVLSYFQWRDSLHCFETYARQVKCYLQSSSVLSKNSLACHSLSWFGSQPPASLSRVKPKGQNHPLFKRKSLPRLLLAGAVSYHSSKSPSFKFLDMKPFQKEGKFESQGKRGSAGRWRGALKTSA